MRAVLFAFASSGPVVNPCVRHTHPSGYRFILPTFALGSTLWENGPSFPGQFRIAVSSLRSR
jgi:hypothetical protein